MHCNCFYLIPAGHPSGSILHIVQVELCDLLSRLGPGQRRLCLVTQHEDRNRGKWPACTDKNGTTCPVSSVPDKDSKPAAIDTCYVSVESCVRENSESLKAHDQRPSQDQVTAQSANSKPQKSHILQLREELFLCWICFRTGTEAATKLLASVILAAMQIVLHFRTCLSLFRKRLNEAGSASKSSSPSSASSSLLSASTTT